MASYELRNVECIDPCDPFGLKRRFVPLLVQPAPKPLNTKTNMSKAVLSSWLPEPKLVTPVTLLNQLTPDAVIQKIHVVDQVFGNQTVEYIVASRPPHPDAPPLAERNLTHDKKAILALWPKSVRGLDHGHVEARLPFTPGQINLTGARTDFATSYIAKYYILGEVPADGLPTYCDCQVQNYSGSRRMIQCSNGERWCLKEWYHLDCISMKDMEVPPDDYEWYCNDCIKDRIGKLKTSNYVPWKPKLSTTQPNNRSHIPPRTEREKQSKRAKNERYRNVKFVEDVATRDRISPGTASSSQAGNPPAGQDLRISVPAVDFRTPTNTQSYSAEMDKQFILANHTADFSLGTLDEARVSLLRGTTTATAEAAIVPPTTTTKKGKWSPAEEDALIEVVRECVGEGLAGEPMWEAAVPRLHLRGVTRTGAACKMVWCRGLRARAAVDERRRKDAENMTTALQDGKKRERGKKGKAKGRKSERERRREAEDREWEDVLLLSAATGSPAVRRVRARSV